MKTIKKHGLALAARLGFSAALTLAITPTIFGQTNLNFNGISATVEGVILISWNSTPNEVYQINYADHLGGNSDGTTSWQTLYTDYPSHGANTFVADAGNYDVTPAIPHPSLSPARFYQIQVLWGDNSDTPPTISIVSPSDGTTLSGDVTVSVSASASDVLGEVKLYVDGEAQWRSPDGTNFLINTCEWPNGPHVLFATAKSQSGLEGAHNGATIQYGRAVSSYVNVSFSNLISQINFSEPFFEPALGQTQQVTAIFAANSDWTLQIQNASSNTVRTVTGRGDSMLFNWDGTADGGVSIPDGVYNYLFTAQTNGNAPEVVSGEGIAGSGGLPSPSLAAMSVVDSTELFAMPADGSGVAVPLELYPPGFDTNSLTIFESSWFQVMPPRPERTSALTTLMNTPNRATAMYSGASSQQTQAPKRKPRSGVKGKVGTFGICYMTYGTNATSSPHPTTGWPYPLPTYVAIDGQSRTGLTVDKPIPSYTASANGFADEMKKKGWKSAFVKGDGEWGATDIKKSSLGGNSIFNTCNFGMLMTHGSAGNSGSTGTEDDSVRYSYVYLGRNNWVRLSDMDLGSAETNGLRWMTLTGCSLLFADAYQSMEQNGKPFYNDNLHLLMGAATVSYSTDNFGPIYATNLLSNNRIADAWMQTGHTAYHHATGITNGVVFRVLGNQNCANDTLALYNDPDPSMDVEYETDDLVYDLASP